MEQLSLASDSASNPSISTSSSGSYIEPGAESTEVPKTYSRRTEGCWARQCTTGPEHSCMCLMAVSRRQDPDCSLPGAASSHARGGNVSPRQRSGLLPIIARAVNPLSLVFLSWNVVHGMCYMLPQCVL